MHRQSASAAVIDDQGRVLLLWRHRFITDRWGWELPGGWINPGEEPAQATRREVLEETGWEPGPLTLLCAYGTDVGISDARVHLYQADGATLQGPPADTTEATRVAWMPLSEVRDLLDGGQVDDGASITALLIYSRSRQSTPRPSRPRRCRKPEQPSEGFASQAPAWRSVTHGSTKTSRLGAAVAAMEIIKGRSGDTGLPSRPADSPLR